MTAPGQPQTGPLPVSPENIEQRARWRTELGQLPTGSFYLGTRRSPSLQCPLLRRHGPPFWDLHSGAWGPHILTLTVGMALRDVPFSLPPPRIHISLWRVPEDPTVREAEGHSAPRSGGGRGEACWGARRAASPANGSVRTAQPQPLSRAHSLTRLHVLMAQLRNTEAQREVRSYPGPDESTNPRLLILAPEPGTLGPLPWGS